MFEEWRRAWRQAIENFRRELAAVEAPADRRNVAMHSEFADARAELHRLEQELSRARKRVAEEREAEEVCRRRQAMAQRIGDHDTGRIAAEFGARHAQRAAVLEQKRAALEAELALRARELAEMEALLRSTRERPREETPGAQAAPPGEAAAVSEDEEAEFRRLERQRRERAAAERLEDLKRKLR